MESLKSIKLWLSKHLAPPKTLFPLVNESIDVVIPCAEKDLETLEECIHGIKTYGSNIRRVVVVSKNPLSKSAEWITEEMFPFSKKDVAMEIFGNNEEAAISFMTQKNSRIGWIYQQLLKLYALSVIPHISSNALILDADVIFLKSTTFMSENGEPFFNVGNQRHKPYFAHAKKLLPFFQRVYPQYSGICHHMLFQKAIIDDLFSYIKKFHDVEPWKAICRMIDHNDLSHSALSEYEIYFNFALLRTQQAHIRPLKWVDLGFIDDKEKFIRENYHYMACQSWQREKNILRVEIYDTAST